MVNEQQVNGLTADSGGHPSALHTVVTSDYQMQRDQVVSWTYYLSSLSILQEHVRQEPPAMASTAEHQPM